MADHFDTLLEIWLGTNYAQGMSFEKKTQNLARIACIACEIHQLGDTTSENERRIGIFKKMSRAAMDLMESNQSITEASKKLANEVLNELASDDPSEFKRIVIHGITHIDFIHDVFDIAKQTYPFQEASSPTHRLCTSNQRHKSPHGKCILFRQCRPHRLTHKCP